MNAHTHTHAHRHIDVAQLMYSSVKEHQVCVNTASSICHMGKAPMTWIVFVLPRLRKQELSYGGRDFP